MLGTPRDPGLMTRALELIFQQLKTYNPDYTSVVKLSYLEVYNEVRALHPPAPAPSLRVSRAIALAYSGGKGANRSGRVWHGATENGP
jgi:hypothetical protein